MKRVILLLLLLDVFPLYAQERYNDIIKLNLSSLPLKNISLQYERGLGARTSVALGVRFQPYGSVPFQDFIRDQVDEPDVQVGNARMGNFAITPEFRFYLGRNDLSGIYLAPYLRYARYRVEAPVTYTGSGTVRTADFEGSIGSFSGGLMLGSQFRLGGRWRLDWWILGAHLGGSGGKLEFRSPLTASEQENIRSTLDDIEIPFYNIRHEIRNDGGTITGRGAWIGVRAFGLALGVGF